MDAKSLRAFKSFLKKNKVPGPTVYDFKTFSGLVWCHSSEVTVCNVCIPCGCQFIFWLSHFQFSYLLMYLGKRHKTTQIFGPLYQQWENWMNLLASSFHLDLPWPCCNHLE